jgi:hypothetical protein
MSSITLGTEIPLLTVFYNFVGEKRRGRTKWTSLDFMTAHPLVP